MASFEHTPQQKKASVHRGAFPREQTPLSVRQLTITSATFVPAANLYRFAGFFGCVRENSESAMYRESASGALMH
jgi:hypothetical protein